MHDAVVDAAFLREQAGKCVRLDQEAAATLRNMAMMYEIIAKRMDERDVNGVPHPMPPLPG